MGARRLACLVLVCTVTQGAVGGCIGSRTVECDWGEICPPGRVCHAPRQSCEYPAAVVACRGFSEGSECLLAAAPGICEGGVCRATGCGNGIVEGDEQCDEGVRNSYAPDAPCRPDCTLQRCGDGIRDTGEECDGESLGGQSCVDRPDGFTGGTLACAGCAYDVSRCVTCGDGRCERDRGEHVRDCPEECAALQVTVSSTASCAVLVDGTAWCWGDNGVGQLGVGSCEREVPLGQVSGLTDAVQLACAHYHCCAARAGGGPVCWGEGLGGKLGDGRGSHGLCSTGVDVSPIPVPVQELTAAPLVGTGAESSCAVDGYGRAWCWGGDVDGQLGDGDVLLAGCAGDCTSTPVSVALPPSSEAQDLAVGEAHACALLTGGEVWCWGANYHGQLGDGTTDDRDAPVPVTGLGPAVTLAAGYQHTCAVLADGSLWCWGANGSDQLGNGGYQGDYCGEPCQQTPAEVVGIGGVMAVAAGDAHTCAVRSDGQLFCWGRGDYGQLGIGEPSSVSTPHPVPLGDVRSVAAAFDHTCAVTALGMVFCWGQNDSGQLGIPGLEYTFSPARVDALNMP